MPLTPVEEFKYGFLLKCADAGLTREETLAAVRRARAMTKEALLPGVLAAAPSVAAAAGVAALGLPIAGGAGLGYAAAKATEGSHGEVADAQQDELEGEYYRLADEARRNAARRRLASLTGRKVSLVRPHI